MKCWRAAVELVVANAQHVKNVPGRKTDPKDADWLARLLRHGLLQPSFVPPPPIRDLRDLTRLRRKTIEMGARVRNRAHKVLEASGIKLGSVVTDVFGVTGQAILEQLADNKTDPAALAELAKGSLKKKKPEIIRALQGSFTAHDAALLKHQLIVHEQLQQRRTAIESQLAKAVTPHEELISRLDEIPGINRDAAIEILGEIGNDMSPWADHRRLAAWAGLCPGNHESAGKRRKVGVRKGNPFLQVHSDAGRDRSGENQRYVLPGQVLQAQQTARLQTSDRGHRARHTHRDLSHDQREQALSRARCSQPSISAQPSQRPSRWSRNSENLGYAVELRTA